MIRALLISLVLAAPAQAQNDEELQAAVTNLWLALRTCLDHAHAPRGTYRAIQTAGFPISPIVAGGVAEFHGFGVEGVIAPVPDAAIGRAYCTVASRIITLAQAEASVLAGAQQAYPDAPTTAPGRFYRAGCHHMQITLQGIRHELSFASMRNNGGCGDGQTVEIAF